MTLIIYYDLDRTMITGTPLTSVLAVDLFSSQVQTLKTWQD